MQTNGRLSRREVASILKCSKSQVRLFEKLGKLHGIQMESANAIPGKMTYAREEVELLRQSWTRATDRLSKKRVDTLKENARLRRVFVAMREGVEGVSELIIATGVAPATIAHAIKLSKMTATELHDDLEREATEAKAKEEAKERKREREREWHLHERERQERLKRPLTGT